MKRFLLSFCIIGICHATFSQARFGIRGGLNIANQKVTNNGNTYLNGNAFPSFHIGGMGEIQLSELFYLQPSLVLTGKGMDLAGIEDGFGNHFTAKFRPYYLELPINLVVKTKLPTTNLSIFGGAGPYLGFGVFGNVDVTGEKEDAFRDEGFKRLDFGINLTAGVETQSGWQFSFHFTPGLANIYAPDDPDITWKNKVASLSVGYFFSKNK